MSHGDILRRDSSSQTRLLSIDPTYGKRAGGGLSPFRTTGAQRGASADVKQVDVNYTFELIDTIVLSPSPSSSELLSL